MSIVEDGARWQGSTYRAPLTPEEEERERLRDEREHERALAFFDRPGSLGWGTLGESPYRPS